MQEAFDYGELAPLEACASCSSESGRLWRVTESLILATSLPECLGTRLVSLRLLLTDVDYRAGSLTPRTIAMPALDRSSPCLVDLGIDCWRVDVDLSDCVTPTTLAKLSIRDKGYGRRGHFTGLVPFLERACHSVLTLSLELDTYANYYCNMSNVAASTPQESIDRMLVRSFQETDPTAMSHLTRLFFGHFRRLELFDLQLNGLRMQRRLEGWRPARRVVLSEYCFAVKSVGATLGSYGCMDFLSQIMAYASDGVTDDLNGVVPPRDRIKLYGRLLRKRLALPAEATKRKHNS